MVVVGPVGRGACSSGRVKWRRSGEHPMRRYPRGQLSWRWPRCVRCKGRGAELSSHERKSHHVAHGFVLYHRFVPLPVRPEASKHLFILLASVRAVNGSTIRSIEINRDGNNGAWPATPGTPLANATFAVLGAPFFLNDHNNRRVINTTQPEGIWLAPGRYWLVVNLTGMGWVVGRLDDQNPRLPIAFLNVRWGPTSKSAVLAFNGCLEEAPPPRRPDKGGHDDDTGTLVGIVLGVSAAVGLIAVGAFALVLWRRRQRSQILYQVVANDEQHL